MERKKERKDVQVEKSSEVQGDRRGRVENGIHRQKTTPKNVFVVLGDEVFTRICAGRTNGGCAELGLDQHQEWKIGGGALMSRCCWTARDQSGPQSLSRERRKGKGKEGGGGGEEEGECRKEKGRKGE